MRVRPARRPGRRARGVFCALALVAFGVAALLTPAAPRPLEQMPLALTVPHGALTEASPEPAVEPLSQELAAVRPPSPPPASLERSFWSASLGRQMPYAVYLPRGYDSGEERYPVLYMLHGLGGNYTDWMQWGLLGAATELIERGEIPPMIIVMPEGERGYWVDHIKGGPQYGSYVSDDLVSFVDATYRTRPERAQRAIGGLSMGAHGALDIAFTNPMLFGVVGGHSLVLRKPEHALQFFGNLENWTAHDPVSLCAGRERTIGDSFALWMDIGKDDPWTPATAAFHERLASHAVPHTWHEWPGGHEPRYWASHVHDYLRFYGGAFAAAPAPRG